MSESVDWKDVGEEVGKAKAPGVSFAPAFPFRTWEAGWFRMSLKLCQPWSHRLNKRSCPWLESARGSWDEPGYFVRGAAPSRRLRGFKKRRRRPTLTFRVSRIRRFLMGG